MSRVQELVTTITCDRCGKGKITVKSSAALIFSGWSRQRGIDLCPKCMSKEHPTTQPGGAL